MLYCPELIDYAALPLIEGVTCTTYPGFPDGVLHVTDATGETTIHAVERIRYISNKVSEWLELPHVDADLSPLHLFAAYKWLMREGSKKYEQTGEVCQASLVPALIGLEGKRVEVLDDFGDNFRYNVGRTNGWLPVHMHSSRAGNVRIPNGIKSARVLRQGRN